MSAVGTAAPASPAIEHLAAVARAELRDALRGVEPAAGRVDLRVERSALPAATRLLCERLGARYVISVGADRRADGAGYEVHHHFALDADRLRVAVRATLDAAKPVTPSITPVVPGASWAELEMHDLLGITSEGHPDPRPLVLPDDFPAGVHPLRKDVPHDYRVPAGDGAAPPRPFPYREPPPGTTVVQMGPFFPVLEEPSQWRLFVDGENVVGADYRGFYCHRAIEKLADAKLNYNQVVSLAERICGICGCVHSTCWCQAVEAAAGIEVPERARIVRTLALELERVQSHLLWLGLACHVVGFDYVFMHAWRLREPVLALAERLSGSRKHYGVNLVGGVTFDVPMARHRDILDALSRVEAETLELVRSLRGDDALLSRLRGVGVLTPDEARATGAVGPTARGSGLAIDVRRDHPYAAYDRFQFDVVVHDTCDVLARTLVRAEEIFQAVRIMQGCVSALHALPEGGLMGDVPAVLPPGLEGVSAVEAPRGEVFHFARTGVRNGPDRWRVRAPSYQNLQAVPLMFKPGTLVADVPIIIGSIDPCFSCTERAELVDRRAGTSRRLRREEFEALARAGAPGAGGGRA